MRYLRRLTLSVLVALALTAAALASEVPESVVVENVNGQQRMVKTYVLSPEADPEALKEPTFEYEGFSYSWAYTTKEEHPYLKTKIVAEPVTVETSKDDLSQILAKLDPTIPYDDGEYTGELALDHTSLSTVAAGYTTKSSTITETKVIGPVDRNDMSYVPNTTVKDGKTLTLTNVEWQIAGTDLAAGELMAASYQAVATYSGSSSYKVATGYVTTATYRGETTSSGVESITYTVVYTGAEILPEVPEVSEDPEDHGDPADTPVDTPVDVDVPADRDIDTDTPEKRSAGHLNIVPVLCTLAVLLLLAGGVVLLLRWYKNVYVYIPGEQPQEYELIARFKADSKVPEIDISGLQPYPSGTVAIEIKRLLARKLVGKEFTVHHQNGSYTYSIQQSRSPDWHEFSLAAEEDTL